MAIAGASKFLNSSTLANLQGRAAQTSNVLGEAAGALDLLDIARSRSDNGIGLSSRARALNKQFLSQTNSLFNQVFSLSGVEFGSIETLQQKILAIRASLPASKLGASFIDDGSDGESTDRGRNVDVKA